MATEILQKGTVPTVNSRGERIGERPFTGADQDNPTVLGGLAGKAEAALRDRAKRIGKALDDGTSDPTRVEYGGSPGSSTGR